MHRSLIMLFALFGWPTACWSQTVLTYHDTLKLHYIVGVDSNNRASFGLSVYEYQGKLYDAAMFPVNQILICDTPSEQVKKIVFESIFESSKSLRKLKRRWEGATVKMISKKNGNDTGVIPPLIQCLEKQAPARYFVSSTPIVADFYVIDCHIPPSWWKPLYCSDIISFRPVILVTHVSRFFR